MDEDGSLAKILTMWLKKGYLLGNHTYSHADLSSISASDFIKEIEKGEEALRTANRGGDFKFFRFPYLHEGETVAKREQIRAYLKTHGYVYAPVTLDFMDYLFNAPLARCLKSGNNKAVGLLRTLMLETASRLTKHQIDAAKQILGPSTPQILLIHIGASQAMWFGDIA